MTAFNKEQLEQPIQSLYEACKTSEKYLHAASLQMQNPGLKALVKRFAQQHRRFAAQHTEIAEQIGFKISTPSRLRTTLRRGWMGIGGAMIVGRANRQEAAAERSDTSIRDLLMRYDQVLELPLPEYAATDLQAQRQSVQKIHQWLQRIVATDQWVVRLYKHPSEAEQAVKQLAGTGFSENQIQTIPLSQITLYADETEERANSTLDTTFTGAVLGGAIGLILGLVIGIIRGLFDPAFDNSSGLFVFSLLRGMVVWTLIIGSFGSLFGFLLGQGVAEDDAEFSAKDLNENATVVSVQTSENNHIEATEILHIWHERRVEEVPA